MLCVKRQSIAALLAGLFAWYSAGRMTPMTTEEAGKKRWKGISKKKHRAISAKGGQSTWATMTAEERSAEMKRRAVVRAKNAEMKRRAAKRKKTK